ncbi:MAG: pilus assembly PilX N-terminal domain-containing protein [bacterium]
MNNKGAVLVFGLVIILVLSVLASSFYFKSINENTLTKRYVESIRAFWLAEAGLARAIDLIPAFDITNATLLDNNANYTYSTRGSVETINATTNLYTINSTGSVRMPSGGAVTRRITAEAVEVTTGPDAANFPFAIETTTSLDIRGAVTINPSDSKKEHSTLDFAALFGSTKSDMESHATHVYTPSTLGAVDGITWVNVPAGSTLTIAGDLAGSGILIISGNTHFSGTVDFNGIIYVIGTLTMTGTVTTNGSVLAESSTTVDTTIKGHVTLNWDQAQINTALDLLSSSTSSIVSWKEN